MCETEQVKNALQERQMKKENGERQMMESFQDYIFCMSVWVKFIGLNCFQLLRLKKSWLNFSLKQLELFFIVLSIENSNLNCHSIFTKKILIYQKERDMFNCYFMKDKYSSSQFIITHYEHKA